MKREVRQFEYVCDGMTRTGAKCPNQVIVTAYDNGDADHRVTQITSSRIVSINGVRWFEPWAFTSRGWLCPDPHRDDPRLQFRRNQGAANS